MELMEITTPSSDYTQRGCSTVAEKLPATRSNKEIGLVYRLRRWHKEIWPGINIPVAFLCLALGLLLWWFVPPGLDPQVWHVFVIFLCTIVGAVLEPLPLTGVCLISIAIAAITNALTQAQVLSGFAEPAVWLVIFAFFISSGFVATGLGRRICFVIFKYFGSSTIGLAYGICLCSVVLGLGIPSATAKAVGILLPIIEPLLKEAFQSDPAIGTQKRAGTYIVMVQNASTSMTAVTWLTAGAWNALMAQFMADVGVELTWLGWAYSLAPVVLVGVAVVPLLMFILCRPEIVRTRQARSAAEERLREIGRMTLPEKAMLVVFILIVLLWVLSSVLPTIFPFTATEVAMLGVAALLILGVLDVQRDIVSDKSAFDLLIWFAVLIMYASQLEAAGFWRWVSGNIVLSSLAPYPCLCVICLLFVLSQYAFASITARVAALYPAFVEISRSAGVPVAVACRALAVCTWAGHVTPYSCTSNPAYYGLGYVSSKRWWLVGVVLMLVNYVILITIGFGYWWLLGYWD
ncbi:conserved hypothetical protein [Perkinsus marinus ATCC 50983]|uniref:Uncharacterized protein n=1 Tax=Perkinsus marinus (strain ATCC 50983 / TXsc) TaxID=423536 RepID=C5K4X3_PERM5|nr:conserved hypothetical protein [Perkinsus marinus ATCC 50983]EER20395.1 conserved hypothetical protein [Perkinsus marinus ATCC 50983]|eukprot:XP_002788599.1 conserved hypothetical protein [Perkinsus marinus ATCC 50983]